MIDRITNIYTTTEALAFAKQILAVRVSPFLETQNKKLKQWD